MANSAAEWRDRANELSAEQAIDLKLPSGITIRARRPDPLQLAMWGRLPLSLAGTVSGDVPQISPAEGDELIRFMRELLIYCCVEPRVSLAPKDNTEIHPHDIPAADSQFIINWAMRVEEARALAGFRSERTDGGGDRGGQDVLDPALGTYGD